MQFHSTNEFDFQMEIEMHLKFSFALLFWLDFQQSNVLFDILYIAREIASKKGKRFNEETEQWTEKHTQQEKGREREMKNKAHMNRYLRNLSCIAYMYAVCVCALLLCSTLDLRSINGYFVTL